MVFSTKGDPKFLSNIWKESKINRSKGYIFIWKAETATTEDWDSSKMIVTRFPKSTDKINDDGNNATPEWII